MSDKLDENTKRRIIEESSIALAVLPIDRYCPLRDDSCDHKCVFYRNGDCLIAAALEKVISLSSEEKASAKDIMDMINEAISKRLTS